MPSAIKLLARGFTRACPVCGQRGLFSWGLVMVEDCPRCDLHFERIEGHWLGAVGLNTIVTFGVLFVVLIGSLILAYPEFPIAPLLVVNIGVAVLVPLLFHASSRTGWTAIDILMRPLEPHEVDWPQIRR
jgi:uncharacterized protein (DUF983 family)